MNQPTERPDDAALAEIAERHVYSTDQFGVLRCLADPDSDLPCEAVRLLDAFRAKEAELRTTQAERDAAWGELLSRVRAGHEAVRFGDHNVLLDVSAGRAECENCGWRYQIASARPTPSDGERVRR